MKEWLMAAVISERPIVTRAGRIQLTWLAAQVDIDRQQLYPNRGPKDLQVVLDTFTSAVSFSSQTGRAQQRTLNKEASGLRAALALQHKKIQALQAQLNKTKLIEQRIHMGKAVAL